MIPIQMQIGPWLVEIGVSSEYPNSSLAGTSSDGSVLVGTRSDRPFRWKNGVTTDLFLDDIDSDVYGGVVSPDGSVVVGRSWNASNPDAKHIFRWSISSTDEVTRQQIGEDLPADSWFEVDYINTNGTVAAGNVSWYDAGQGQSGGFAWHWTFWGGV